MRKTLWMLVGVGVLLLLPRAYGTDVSGTWKGAFDYQGKSVPLTFHLTMAGDAVKGSVEGLPTTPAGIQDGKTAGDKVSFWLNTDYQGETYKLVFTGQASSGGNEISFTLATEDGSWTAGLLARRSTATGAVMPPDVTGMWKGSFEFQGSAVPVTLTLTSTAGVVTGNVQGMIQGSPEKPVEIHNGKLDGDVLTFWVNTDYQGETYKILYSGRIAEGKIHLAFGTEDGSWSSEMTVGKAADGGQ